MESNANLMNAEDYGLSFSEEVNEKIQAVFADTESQEMRAYAANVLIGNTPAYKLNEHVGDEFELTGFHVKDVKYEGRSGKYTTLFGILKGKPCAYGSSSDKVYNAVMMIAAVYGIPATWKQRIRVKIRMSTYGDTGKAYSLEIME